MSAIDRDTAFEMAERLDKVQYKLLFFDCATSVLRGASEGVLFGASLILGDLRGEIIAVEGALRPAPIASAGL
jgi:hypothetical protein